MPKKITDILTVTFSLPPQAHKNIPHAYIATILNLNSLIPSLNLALED